MSADLKSTIDSAWDDREAIGAETQGATRAAVDRALDLLDSG